MTFFRTFFIQPRVNHLLLGNPTTIWGDNPTTGWKRTHDHRETHLRRLKMKNRFFKKKLPNSFEQVEILKESQGFPALCDTFFQNPHEERVSIGSFSTEHFGLRGRMRSTFSKRVRNFGTRLVRKRRKFVRTDPHPIILGISKCKIDRRRSRNVMEPLRTPKTAIKN